MLVSKLVFLFFNLYIFFSLFRRQRKENVPKRKESTESFSITSHTFGYKIKLLRANPHSYAGYHTSYTPAIQSCMHYCPERVRKHNSEGKRFGVAENIHSNSRPQGVKNGCVFFFFFLRRSFLFF